jgi:hypothetical protein
METKMSDRAFQDANCFEVWDRHGGVEFYVMHSSFAPAERNWEVVVTISEEDGWNGQKSEFRMTREEATMMKEFLIRKGY